MKRLFCPDFLCAANTLLCIYEMDENEEIVNYDQLLADLLPFAVDGIGQELVPRYT